MIKARKIAAACLMGSTMLIACNGPDSRETRQSNVLATNRAPMTTEPSQKLTPIVGPINYVALGDSTGAGIGAKEGGYVARLFKRISAQRPGSQLTNLCVSGATTADVLRNQLKRNLGDDVNLVTLGIGINDIGHGLTVDQFAQNYEEILGKLKGSRATIVVTNIPDISTAPRIPGIIRDEYQRLIIEFNRALEAIAARHGVIVFDVYTITREVLPTNLQYFSADGFHPSDAGYEFWAEKMWPTVAGAIGEVEPKRSGN
jgi:lysophospholipase L1-like esterase